MRYSSFAFALSGPKTFLSSGWKSSGKLARMDISSTLTYENIGIEPERARELTWRADWKTWMQEIRGSELNGWIDLQTSTSSARNARSEF
jgi:hypothetical protein